MNDKDQVPVEVMIMAEVYEAAKARAAVQAQTMARVAREVLYRQADHARPIKTMDDLVYPAARQPGIKRKRLRFRVPRDTRTQATQRIRASGRTVAAAMEEGLVRYAKTGEFDD